jgi:hypothetical protein
MALPNMIELNAFDVACVADLTDEEAALLSFATLGVIPALHKTAINNTEG